MTCVSHVDACMRSSHLECGVLCSPRDKTTKSSRVSMFSILSSLLLNSDRSVSFFNLLNPSSLVMLLKDRSSHVRLTCREYTALG